MTDEDKISLNDGDEEEYHFTDEDIDRELSQLDVENEGDDLQTPPLGDDAPAPDAGQTGSSGSKVDALKGHLLGLIGKIKAVDFKNLTRKQMLMVVGGGIVVLVLFAKLLGGGSAAPSTAAENTTGNFGSGAQQAAPSFGGGQALPNQQFQQVQQSYPEQKSHYNSTSTANMFGHVDKKQNNEADESASTEVQEAVDTLKKNDQKIATQINIMNSKISTLESDLGSINHQLLLISDKIQTAQLSGNRVNHSSSSATQPVKKAYKPKTESQTKKDFHPPAGTNKHGEYTVQAVVPGRAWLQAHDGRTLSVTVGEDVPGLGHVVSINSYSGNVTTSTGIVVRFSEGV